MQNNITNTIKLIKRQVLFKYLGFRLKS